MTQLDKAAEGDLVRQAQQGNTAAFGQLVARYQRVVFQIAYRLIRNRQEAEDVAQDTFVKAYQALERFDPERPLAPWLYRIARNTALNQIKRVRPETPLLEEALPAHSDTEPETSVIAAETRNKARTSLRAALAALPANYRVVIELRHFQGLSYQEMSAVLDEPISNVKSWLFRARHRLRQLLEEGSDAG